MVLTGSPPFALKTLFLKMSLTRRRGDAKYETARIPVFFAPPRLRVRSPVTHGFNTEPAEHMLRYPKHVTISLREGEAVQRLCRAEVDAAIDDRGGRVDILFELRRVQDLELVGGTDDGEAALFVEQINLAVARHR